MTLGLLLYLSGGLFFALSWLYAGQELGNTSTTKERLWLITSSLLVFSVWPAILIASIIGRALGDDDFM